MTAMILMDLESNEVGQVMFSHKKVYKNENFNLCSETIKRHYLTSSPFVGHYRSLSGLQGRRHKYFHIKSTTALPTNKGPTTYISI